MNKFEILLIDSLYHLFMDRGMYQVRSKIQYKTSIDGFNNDCNLFFQYDSTLKTESLFEICQENKQKLIFVSKYLIENSKASFPEIVKKIFPKDFADILYIKNKLLFFNFSKRNNFSMQSGSLSDKLTLYKLYFHDRSDIYINYFIIEDGVINNNGYLYFFYNKILPSLSGDTKISLLSSYARYITTIIFKNNNNEHFLFLGLYILLICIEKVKKNYEEKDFLYLYLWISFIFIELKMYKEAIIFLKYHILKTLFYFNIVTGETLVAILKSYLKIKNYSGFDKIYLKINTLSYYYARNNYNEIVGNNFLGNRFKLYHYKTQREFELGTNKKFLAYHFISVYLYTVQISKGWESSNFRFIINNVSYNKQLTDKLLDESYRSRYNVFINRTMRNKIYTVIFNLYILVKMNENSTDIKYSCGGLEKYSFQYVKYYLS